MPTREQNILDLILTNSPGLVKSSHVIPGLSDHEALVSDFDLNPLFTRKAPRKIHIFSKANWPEIKNEISKFSADYFSRLQNSSVEVKWTEFKSNLTSIIDKYVPSKFISTRYNLPWMSRAILRLSRKKHRLFKKAKRSHKASMWERYKSCKKQVTQGLKRARDDFINRAVTSAFESNDTKPFWKYVKSKKSDNCVQKWCRFASF